MLSTPRGTQLTREAASLHGYVVGLLCREAPRWYLLKSLRHHSKKRRSLHQSGWCVTHGTAQASPGPAAAYTLTCPEDVPASTEEASALIIILPGAYMRPSDFSSLIQALQAELSGHVCVWLSAVHPAWQELDPTAPDVMQQAAACMGAAVDAALEGARTKGFPAIVLPSGRCKNLVLLSHSSATLFAAPLAARRAGAFALLGSYIFPTAQAFALLSEWSRPVLHVGGSLDGQARFSKLAFPALDAAMAAFKLGPRHAAAHKPVVLLEGVNHAQLSNAILREGDLEPEQADAAAMRGAARTIGSFIAAHMSAERDVRDGAVQRLLEECTRTAKWFSPYTQALGRGSPALLWQAAMQANTHGALATGAAAGTSTAAATATQAGVAQALLPGGVLACAYGAEVMPDEEASRRFAMAVQQHLAAAACASGANVRVAASVHTDPAMFIHSQPALLMDSGGLLVHAHCYLHRPSLVPFGHRIPVAPHYFLKLKSPAAIRMRLGLEPMENDGADSDLAAGVNRATHEGALSLVADEARKRYERRGRRLHFSPDRDVTREVPTPAAWVEEHHLAIVTTGPGQAEVCSPVVRVPASEDAAAERFTGVHYIKCLSLAAVIEYILCDSLRH